ncbi:hypothetical protein PpBr36_01615 [Pyricularia pennisetigena]|nr:hypothetical protein PpBr36_01615 [Pyricularia pennisetigena]TLS28960.1 hypothetical protein PpBr36_01615 [Pyricularia pennisetigena]
MGSHREARPGRGPGGRSRVLGPQIALMKETIAECDAY